MRRLRPKVKFPWVCPVGYLTKLVQTPICYIFRHFQTFSDILQRFATSSDILRHFELTTKRKEKYFYTFIVKSLKKEQNSTNLLLWPPICRNKPAITPKWFNSLDTNSTKRNYEIWKNKRRSPQPKLVNFFWICKLWKNNWNKKNLLQVWKPQVIVGELHHAHIG